jgi:RNA polymerase sigma-70 factor, ECF subfamily
MSGALSPALARLMAAGRAAWPELRLALPEEAQIARHLARHLDGAAEPAALRAGELFLACACALGDERAVAILDARYLARIPEFLARREPSALAIFDVHQALRERLLASGTRQAGSIADYDGRGSLEGWLRLSCLRMHGDLRQRGGGSLGRALGAGAGASLRAGGGAAPPSPGPTEAAAQHDATWGRHGRAIAEALGEALAALPARDRTVLRLDAVEGLGRERIGATFGVHPAAAERWVQAARGRLVERAARLLRERQRLGQRELDGLLDAVRSRLDLELKALLTSAKD